MKNKIQNLEEIWELKSKEFIKIKLREEDVPESTDEFKRHILFCGGTGCVSAESLKMIEACREGIKKRGLDKEILVSQTGCFGFCSQGPIIKIHPEDVFYVKVKMEDIEELIEEHIVNNKIVKRLLYEDPKTHEHLPKQHDISFYKKQHRIALRNCGNIDPENILEYIAYRGYEALGRVLTTMIPEDVIEIMKASGLRGRGGGGFPVGLKWEATRKPVSDEKYIFCNADEGDPGAFMDRSILEGDPHTVLEAMAIAGYATGASQGIIYIRAEYPLAIQRLEIAIKEAYDLGFLGKDIFDSRFNFDIKIKLGAGAFVCGEETALIHSVEGKRGESTKKPPFPSIEGYKKKPTSVNNVETFANIPPIILNGPQWFCSMGTEKSKGTKVFSLAGKINNIGLIEVPMGTTLREIIYEIGGGIANDKEFKAVQTGGPSGGVITARDLDTPIDYESLLAIGSMMGSGGMIVLEEDDCMVDIAKFYLEFTQDESCGKCTPCRLGTKRMHEILVRISEGEGKMEDIESLRTLGRMIKDSSLCGLGQSAPNPVLSTLEYFYDEYVTHIVDKTCPAGRCKALLKYSIIEEKCIGCTACARVCPVDAISGKPKEKHVIDPELCIGCGACYDACRFNAIIKP